MRKDLIRKELCLTVWGMVVMISLTFAAPAQTLTTVHMFQSISSTSGTNFDGASPGAGLVPLGSVLGGTTANGGRYGAGTIFYLKTDGTGFNVARPLTNAPDAASLIADLTPSGNAFFGSAFAGGSAGAGAVFSGQTNGSSSIVCNFVAVNSHTATNTTGASPGAAVILSGGFLYGTACAGGNFANGVVFSVPTKGTASSVLHTFSALDSNTGTNTDGATPWGGLVLSGNTLYGTTSAGGTGGSGTVFSVTTNGNNFTTLYSFSAMDPATATNTDGAIPYGGLVLSNGVLYGTTVAGGCGENGVIFSISTNGSNFAVLHQFSSRDALTRTNTDGAKPVANLLLSGGTLYGTAPVGGSGNSGTVFLVKTDGSQFAALYHFTAANPGNGTNTDGAFPCGDLVQMGASLYGTTAAGGFGAAGTVFNLMLPLPPAVITQIFPNLDGSLTLIFAGSPNSTNVIQTTPDLTAPVMWQSLSTNTADGGGAWQFTDPQGSQFPARFYRSYSP